MFKLKRAYEEPLPDDGERVLVERLWPRGISKERAKLDLWLKEVAPSPALRQWFGHDPAKWEEFRRRYWAELDDNPLPVVSLRQKGNGRPVTLVYSARDEEHNAAVALREYLESRRGSGAPSGNLHS